MSRAKQIIESVDAAVNAIDPEVAKKVIFGLIATGALSAKALTSYLKRRRERGHDYYGAEGYDMGDPTRGLYKKEGIGSVKSRTNTRKTGRNKRR